MLPIHRGLAFLLILLLNSLVQIQAYGIHKNNIDRELASRKEETKKSKCKSQYQSYDPKLSCSSFTDSKSGTKCIPTRSQTICEPLLLQVYKILGEETAKKIAKLRRCTCELIEWHSINGSSEYEINLVASSDSLYEGPLVVGKNLFWSSISEGIMRRAPDGEISVYVPATKRFVPHGLQWDKTTNTIIVTSAENMGKGAVYRVEQDRTLTKLTNGVLLNNPNDLDVSSTGVIFFTDPYWLTQQLPISGRNGVYSIQNCRVKLERNFLTESPLAQPNGIHLSEDEKTLYVTLTGTSKVVKFKVKQKRNEKDRRLRGLVQKHKSGDMYKSVNHDCQNHNALYSHNKPTNKVRKYKDDFDFEFHDDHFHYEASESNYNDDWFENTKRKDKDDNGWKQKYDDDENGDDEYYDDDENGDDYYYDDENDEDFSSVTLEYEGSMDGTLSAPVLPDGLAIYRGVLYVATNLDYIQMVPLDGETDIQGIDLYDAGIYGITNLDIDPTDGTIYFTQRYPGSCGDQIFEMKRK